MYIYLTFVSKTKSYLVFCIVIVVRIRHKRVAIHPTCFWPVLPTHTVQWNIWVQMSTFTAFFYIYVNFTTVFFIILSVSYCFVTDIRSCYHINTIAKWIKDPWPPKQLFLGAANVSHVPKFTVDIWTQQFHCFCVCGQNGPKTGWMYCNICGLFMYSVLILNDYHLKGHFISAGND